MPESPETQLAPQPDDALRAILAAEDDEALEEALAAADEVTAAHAVTAAPDLERKTELLWAMEDAQRRQVLDRVPPALVGALVQNLEEDNKYLLGDVSFEQFRALLELCSPERQYYWITTPLSFTDARANALPLLLPTRLLAEILLTRPEFEGHLRAMADYNLEDQRLPPDLMADPAQTLVDLFGAENLLRIFPIQDPTLAHLLQTILDYDADRYADLIREGLRLSDYSENHPLEYAALVEDPVLLKEIALPAAAAGEGLEAEEAAPEVPMALVPLRSSLLARAAAHLPAGRRAQVANELQMLYIRQAVAEGGSFLLTDLQRAARGVEAYLLLGMRAEAGGGDEGLVLQRRPLNKLMQSGARVMEAIRQIALRLHPLERVFDPEVRALVESVLKPRLTLSPEGEPRLQLLPAGNLPEQVDLETAGALLQRAAAWTDFARALGLDRTAAALKEAGSLSALQEQLAVGAVLFGRVELGLAEESDRRRFAARYVTDGAPNSAAEEGLKKAVEAWAHERSLEPPLEILREALGRVAASEAD